MIDWPAFAVVAVVSLVGACVVVAVASIGFRLLDFGVRVRSAGPARRRAARVIANVLFVVCGAIVLFGVYLIVPAFH